MQQAVHISKEDPESRVSVVSDNTGVFTLLLYFSWRSFNQEWLRSHQLRVALAVTYRKLLVYILILYPQSWVEIHLL